MGGVPASPASAIRDRAGVDRFLDHLTRFGIKLGLSTIRRLLAELGDPHLRYPQIHVGGTNGKGSTAVFADAVLSAAGLAVGRYTSPHLEDFRERIAVGGVPIGDPDLIRDTDAVAAAAAGCDPPPTFFEAATAIAFHHFAHAASGGPVDAAVVEVGLGGRLDATNVLTPRVCVITQVALDHTEHLGTTLAEVAAEKAGIVKPGVPVVTAAEGEVLDVIRKRCAETGSPLYVLGEDFRVRGGERFSYHGLRTNYAGLSLSLAGDHQRRNAALALAAVELFYPPGVSVAEAGVARALAAARWPGRLERVLEHPEVILDCAHNPDGARVLANHLEGSDRPLWLVLGVLADKDFEGMARELAPLGAAVILTAPATGRRGDLRRQADIARRCGMAAQVIPGVAEAVEAATGAARKAGGRVCVAGSIYTVGEARAFLRNRPSAP